MGLLTALVLFAGDRLFARGGDRVANLLQGVWRGGQEVGGGYDDGEDLKKNGLEKNGKEGGESCGGDRAANLLQGVRGGEETEGGWYDRVD